MSIQLIRTSARCLGLLPAASRTPKLSVRNHCLKCIRIIGGKVINRCRRCLHLPPSLATFSVQCAARRQQPERAAQDQCLGQCHFQSSRV